ncbi:MAG TPA: CYTH and CHAD domain-containing protein [Pseudonocardia sp.]|jgi:CHAD domain-containing protein
MSSGTAATTVRETERKYELDDTAELPDPSGLAGLDAGSGAQEQRLEALYFDTEDLRLLRARITLRRREGGHDEGWHLKLPVDGDSRDEVQLPLTEERTTPPEELLVLVRLHTRGAPLSPVAQLNTHRRRWVLSDEGGREQAELVDDTVHAHTLGRSTSALSWREVEVELGEHGEAGLLDRIERELVRGGVRRSGSRSKLGRVLGDQLIERRAAARAGRTDLKPGSAGEAVLDYLRAQADELRGRDAPVRRDEPDAVHRMRVAARRMRSTLQAYRRVLDRRGTDHLVEELRWLGRELNDARDTEVIAERLDSTVAELPEELVLGPVAAQLTRSLQRRRADGQERAVAALDSQRYLALHDAVDTLLEQPPLAKGARRPAGEELRAGVAKAWRRTAKRMAEADSLPQGPERDAALHELRKSAKRLRYAVEVAEPSGGKRAKRTRKDLKKVHTVLGEHQDAVVARPVIRELAVQAHLDGGNGFTHGVLHGREAARSDRAERDLPAAWHRLTHRKTVKWLEN